MQTFIENSTSEPVARRSSTTKADTAYQVLEAKQLLAADLVGHEPAELGFILSAPQIVYLDVNGEKGVEYDGPEKVKLDVPAFDATLAGLGGQEQAILDLVMAQLERDFTGTGISFTLDRPDPSIEYSTIYLGGNDSAFRQWGRFQGLAENNDFGNLNKTDNAFVFSEVIAAHNFLVELNKNVSFAIDLAEKVGHETTHIIGFAETDSHSRSLLGELAFAEWFPDADRTYTATGGFTTATRATEDIRWIVMHTTEGYFAGDVNRLTTSGEVSAHYLVDRDGTIYQLVENSDIAWHAGNLLYNNASIGIEISHLSTAEDTVTEEQHYSVARLVAWLTTELEIDRVYPFDAVAPASPTSGSGVIGHGNIPNPNNPTQGGGASGHTDPKNFNWSAFTKRVEHAETVHQMRLAQQQLAVLNQTLYVVGSGDVDTSLTLDNENGSLFVRTSSSSVEKSFGLSEYGFFNKIFLFTGITGDDIVDFRSDPLNRPIDVFVGSGTDIVLVGGGNDFVFGSEGNDWIEGGRGLDSLHGGAGSDVIFGQSSARNELLFFAPKDTIYGEAGDDLLYGNQSVGTSSAIIDGGRGDNRIWNTFGHSEIPLGIAGRFVLVGNEDDSVISLSISNFWGSQLLVSIDGYETIIGDWVFNSTSSAFFSAIILPGGGDDLVDLTLSPVWGFVDTCSGRDRVRGSTKDDIIHGGSGGDYELDGGPGNDTIWGGRGADVINGGFGEDLVAGGEDTELDIVFGGPNGDKFITVSPDVDDFDSSVPKEKRLNAALVSSSYLVAYNGDVNGLFHGAAFSSSNPTPPPTFAIAPGAPGFAEFSIDSNVVTRGDGFVVTVRTDRTGSWARMTLYVDVNQNGRFDASTDKKLLTTRGHTVDFRGHVRTSELLPGTYQIRARLEAYDGSVSQSSPLTLTILSNSSTPPGLPSHLSFRSEDAQLVIPHKNGDAFVPGNQIDGIGQIDLFELTIGTSGNHGFTTTGIETVRAIYDSNGDIVGGPVAGGSSLIVTLSEGETYTLAVSARFPETGVYDLNITGRNQISNGDILTPPGNYAGTATGVFASGNTIDYWKIVTPTTATLLDVLVQADAGLDLWVRIADTNNQVIGFANLGQPGSHEVLRNLPVTPNTIYYITLHGLFGTTGNYAVTADYYPDDIGLPPTILVSTALANYKPLTPHADGDFVLPGQQITAAGQFRYFHIAPTNSGRFMLRTTGNTDTQVGLYLGNGAELIAFSDNDGPGLNGQVEFDLIGGDEYWLVVRGAGNSIGPFGIEVFGPDQFRQPLLIGGLALKGNASFSLGVTSNRQHYFSVLAPVGATSVNLQAVVNDPATRPMDLWWSIEDAAGNITVVDAAGVNGSETLSNFPVVGGQLYLITITSKDRAPGPATFYADFAPDSNGTGEFVVNSTILGDQDSPRVSMNATGRSVVVWQSLEQNADDDIYAQIFDSNGTPVGFEFRVNNADVGVNQNNPDVAIAQDGTFWVSWYDESLSQIRIRRVNANGIALTGEISSGLATYEARVAVQNDGSVLVFGANGTQALARTFGFNGVATSPIRIIDDPSGSKDVINVAISTSATGEYVATWTREGTYYGVIAQRLDGTANKVGAEIVVHSSTLGQFDSSVSAASDGSFAVAFRQNDTDGTFSNVYLAVFDGASQPMGSVASVHQNSVGSQDHPTVKIKQDGSSLVAWTSPDQDGSGKGVFFRQFDRFANPFLPEETRLNEFTVGDQERPVLSGNGGDIFFPVWESNWQDGNGDSIVGHRVSMPTPLPAPRISVIETVGVPNDNFLPFGRSAVGSTAVLRSIQIKNTGSATLVGSLSTTNPAYSIIGSPNFSILPGQTANFDIVLSTAAKGFFVGELVIQHNADNSPYAVSLSGTIGPVADSFESNESDETATDLGVITNLTVNGLTVHSDSDQDWFRFTVGAYSKVDISATFLHAEGNIELVVYDNNLGILGVSASNSDGELVSIFLDAGETAFIRIFVSGEAINDYSLTLFATETNRTPVVLDQYFVVAENKAGGSLVGNLVANDPDPGQTLTYSITGGTGAGIFVIDPVTGAISLAANAQLNYESVSWYTLEVEVTDNGNPILSDSATVTMNVADVAEVASVVLGDGTNQHSRIDKVTITFDNLVDFDNGDVLSAFHFFRRVTNSSVSLVLDSIDESSGVTVVTLRFTGTLTRGTTGALVDGNYQLDVNGSKVFVRGSLLAGTSYSIGNNQAGDDKFYALFGDVNGDRKVNVIDLFFFRQTYGLNSTSTSFNPLFDFNGDGIINVLDLFQFRSRYGTSI